MKWWKRKRLDDSNMQAIYDLLSASAQNRAELRTHVEHLRQVVEGGGLTPMQGEEEK